MRSVNFKIKLSLLAFGFIIQSCTKDDVLTLDQTVKDETNTVTIITEWNSLWLELDRYTSSMRPNATARALAYIHLVSYETALSSMEGYTSNTNRLDGFKLDFNRRAINVNLNLALNTSYAKAMDHFMYNVQSDIDTKIEELKSVKQKELSENLSEEVIQNSIEWGEYVANQIIAYSKTDREAEAQITNPQPFSYEPPKAEGYWTYSDDAERAWFPYWGSARTFVISSKETSSIPPPITYSEVVDSEYYLQMKEVYTISNTAKTEQNEDLWIAEFWSDDVEGLMMSPPGRQISIAIQLIEQLNLSYEKSLALLLKLGFSLNDAAVSTWADKYEYMVMRPSVYIHEFIDPDFQTNLYRFINWPDPSFPGYPSGHSTFASAAAGVFINEFGNTINFVDKSHEGRTEFRGTPRQFSSFSQMAEENAYSRIPFGVHIKMDCDEGIRLGYEISDAINKYKLN